MPYYPPLSSAAVIAALGYTPVNRGGDTMSGTLTVGAVVLETDANGIISLGGSNKTPGFDFNSFNGALNDYDVRVQVTGGSNGINGVGTYAFYASNFSQISGGVSGTRTVSNISAANTSPTVGDEVNSTLFMNNSSSALVEMQRIGVRITTLTAGAEASILMFGVRTAGATAYSTFLSGTQFSPFTDDGVALGSGANKWGDLFLGSGGVINFNNGNVTITHSAGVLTLSDATDIALGTTTGTKIGTATTQKLGFYNKTPIVLQTGVAVTAGGIHAALVNLGLITA